MARSNVSKQQQSDRTRNFATVVYPSKEYIEKYIQEHDIKDYSYSGEGENAFGLFDEKLLEVIIQSHVTCIISPLHYKDINPDGNIKKPHFHILFIFETVKSYETQVKPFFDSFGGVGREFVQSCRGYARYLCHFDNPEKAQYLEREIRTFAGADYKSIISLPSDDVKQLKDIINFIEKYDIVCYSDFVMLIATYNPDWFSTVAMSRSYFVDKYIKSRAWKQSALTKNEIENSKMRFENGILYKDYYDNNELVESEILEG